MDSVRSLLTCATSRPGRVSSMRVAQFLRLAILLISVCLFPAHAHASATWGPGGRVVTSQALLVPNFSSAPQAGGGALVAWSDRRTDANGDVYVQRLDGSGVTFWAAGGVAVCVASGTQSEPQVVSDGSGGAVVVWSDTRSGSGQIYAQRVSAQGQALWTVNGIRMGNGTGEAMARVESDGVGGALVVWNVGQTVRMQRVSGDGTLQWGANGIPVTTTLSMASSVQLVSDGAGGAFLAWTDGRNGQSWDIYAQHVDNNGALLWGSGGVGVATVLARTEIEPALVRDGSGGVLVSWVWDRLGPWEVWVQRL